MGAALVAAHGTRYIFDDKHLSDFGNEFLIPMFEQLL
jgi:hypothetical protein